MDNAKQREAAVQAARQYFSAGLNCSECVFKSYLDTAKPAGFAPETVALASCFGGGMGGTKNTCGAVIGAGMALGTKIGRTDPLAKETLEERFAELNGEDGIYAKTRNFVREFEAEFGSVKCDDLTKDYEWHSRERKKNCQKFIMYCAEAAIRHTEQ